MEITRKNFAMMLPHLENAIKTSDFVAVDFELSGIDADVSQDHLYQSLFDCPQMRYNISRQIAIEFIPCQLGIATFRKVSSENKYTCDIFNVFLFPSILGRLTREFKVQSSAIQFLQKHKFDFNKCFTQGVPFMNHSKLAQLRECIIQNRVYLSDIEEDELQSLIESVKKWNYSLFGSSLPLKTGTVENRLELDVSSICLSDALFYAYQIQKSFPALIIDLVEHDGKILKFYVKVEADTKTVAKNIEFILDKICYHYRGCCLLMDQLIEAKKPIVGHHLYFDLLFLYESFYDTLPLRYETFKKKFSLLFPVVFDTKTLSFDLRKELQKRGCNQFNLGNLFEFLDKTKEGKFWALDQPIIEIENEKLIGYEDRKNLHDAAYDAFLTGCVFIRLAQIFRYRSGLKSAAKSVNDHLSSVVKYLGQIHVFKASFPYMKLDGHDPISDRPSWIVASHQNSNLQIDRLTFRDLISNGGVADVKFFGNGRKALIAALSENSWRDIRRQLKHAGFIVQPYNFWLQDKKGRFMVWTSFFLCISVAAISSFNFFKNTN